MKQFLYTRTSGDWNINSYSKKKLKSTKRELRTQVFFNYPDDCSETTLQKIKSEIRRGMEFFTLKDGMLFGSRYELGKLGTFTEEIH